VPGCATDATNAGRGFTRSIAATMAQASAKWAVHVHGTNPQNLIEYIMRQKIYDSLYWKQHCFGLSAEALVDKAVELSFVGGMFGEPRKPTDFSCLLLKLLQIAPDKDIRNDEFKYLRVLGAMYFRLVGRAADVYRYLEPLLNDYRRIRVRNPDGAFSLAYIDEMIDQLLTQEYVFNIALPRLPARSVLEAAGQLPPRTSSMQDQFEAKRDEFERDIRAKLRREGMYAYGVETKKREKWKISKDDAKNKKQKVQRDDEIEDGELDDVRKGGGGGGSGGGGGGSGGGESMSVEETNALRASLGLPPLK
jgi:pre-mRNA-splicing factor 38A